VNHAFTNLMAWLNGMGSWGYGLVMAVPILLYLAYTYTRKTPPPVVPSPTPSIAPTPLAMAQTQQLSNVLSTVMGWSQPGAIPTTADFPAPMIAKMKQELDQISAAQISGHIAALADLGHVVAPATPLVKT
jgi:hypothetical protein